MATACSTTHISLHGRPLDDDFVQPIATSHPSCRSLISVDSLLRLPSSTIRPWIVDYTRQSGYFSSSIARSTSRVYRYGRPFDDNVAEVITTLQRLLVCSSRLRAFLAPVSGDCPRCIAMLSKSVCGSLFNLFPLGCSVVLVNCFLRCM